MGKFLVMIEDRHGKIQLDREGKKGLCGGISGFMEAKVNDRPGKKLCYNSQLIPYNLYKRPQRGLVLDKDPRRDSCNKAGGGEQENDGRVLTRIFVTTDLYPSNMYMTLEYGPLMV